LTQKLDGLTKNGDQTGEVTAITRRSPILSEEFHLWVVYLGIGQLPISLANDFVFRPLSTLVDQKNMVYNPQKPWMILG